MISPILQNKTMHLIAYFCHVPQPDGLVIRSRSQDSGVRVPSQSRDSCEMALEVMYQRSCLRIPYLDCTIRSWSSCQRRFRPLARSVVVVSYSSWQYISHSARIWRQQLLFCALAASCVVHSVTKQAVLGVVVCLYPLVPPASAGGSFPRHRTRLRMHIDYLRPYLHLYCMRCHFVRVSAQMYTLDDGLEKAGLASLILCDGASGSVRGHPFASCLLCSLRECS